MRRALVIAALTVAAPATAAANPVDLFGFGGRGNGMGGAQTAATTDVGANYYNPGALAVPDELVFGAGYQYNSLSLSMNDGDQGLDASHGFSMGMIVPGNFLGQHIAFGAGVYLPDQSVVTVKTRPAEQPRWALYDSRPNRLFFGGHLAVRITDDLRFGAGVGTVADTSGTYTLIGRLGFPVPEESDLGLAIDVSATPVVYPQAGILWDANDWLSLGATYRGDFVLEAIQIVRFDADIGPPNQEPAVEDAFLDIDALALALYQPRQLALGFAAQLTPRLLLAADVTYEDWSGYVNPTPDIKIELDVGQFNEFVDLEDFPPLQDLRFHDVMSVNLGAELVASKSAATEWTVRAGYAYDPSPAPEQVGESNFVDNDRHTLSLGAGVSMAEVTEALEYPFDIDLYVSATFMPTRTHEKVSPSTVTGDYESSGHVIAGGIATSWRF
jgi:long-chain fatty acid transport protein